MKGRKEEMLCLKIAWVKVLRHVESQEKMRKATSLTEDSVQDEKVG